MKEEVNNCSHEFQYSHKESEGGTFAETRVREWDVLICPKCAEIRRREIT